MAEQQKKFDFGSPYYLDEDDHPQINRCRVVLSHEEDNYALWKLDFLRVLANKHKTGFVDGTIEKPEASSPVYDRWQRCNSLVMRWMWNSMSEAVGNTVTCAETAREMWENLRTKFVPCVDLKIYQIRRKMATIRQDGDSVAKYYEKLSRAWLELSVYDPVHECKCGGCECETTKRAKEAREKEERYAFLMGLNQSLLVVKTQIMFMKPPPSIRQAYVMVKQAESMMKKKSRH